VLQNWLDDYTWLREHLDWGVITYTFHPFVIGRGHRMIVLEKLIRHLKDNGAVFMHLGDAAGAFRARR
jgi:peptidoglycan/xylan/chitin deacetylase (PgdA/CDA1 family)